MYAPGADDVVLAQLPAMRCMTSLLDFVHIVGSFIFAYGPCHPHVAVLSKGIPSCCFDGLFWRSSAL
jgi:hypothetical protein